MTLEEKGPLQRLRLFRRAEELGNVSQAWREAGLVRSLYDQLRGPFLAYGPIGLHPKAPPWAAGEATQPQRLDRAPDPGRGPGPAGLGPQRISDQLALRGTFVAPSSVYRALNRHRHWAAGSSVSGSWSSVWEQRLGAASGRSVLEEHSAARAGLLSKRSEAWKRPVPRPSGPISKPTSPGGAGWFRLLLHRKTQDRKTQDRKIRDRKIQGSGKSLAGHGL